MNSYRFLVRYTQQKKDHIIVDILSDRFPGPLKTIADALSSVINIVFFTIVSWQIFVWGMKLSESGELSETLKMVYHPFVYSVAAGFAVLSFTCTVEFITGLRKPSMPSLTTMAPAENDGCNFSDKPEEERT